MRQSDRVTWRRVKRPTGSWSLLCVTFCVLAPGEEVRAQNVFGSYLTNGPPRIVETLSQETRDGVQITRLTYLNRTIPVTGEEVVIYGILARPVKDGTYPGILVCHGGSGNVSEKWVQSWAKRGYVAFGVDAPGYCNLTRTPTTGPWENYKWRTFAVSDDDIRRNPLYDGVAAGLNALALLRAQPDVDRTRIGIVGISWGGYMTTMLSGVAGDWVRASFSLYGCGYFDRGSEWMRPIHWWMKRRGETDTWLRHLDAGRRAAGTQSHFLMCAAANDWFFWLPAVMATYNEIQSPKSIVIAPNASHALPVPGGRGGGGHLTSMGLQWLDLHLKGEGKPFPTCQPVGRAVREGAAIRVCVQVDSPAALKGVSVYHSAGEHPWRNRWWQQVETAQEENGRFSASIPVHEPELPIHWLALASDERDITVSTTQQELAPLKLGFLPEERSECLFHEDFESPDVRRKWILPFARHFGHARRAFSKDAAHTGKLGLSLSGRIVVCRGDIRGEALRRSGARGISLWARSEGGTGFHAALMAEGDNTGQRYYWYAPVENPGTDWTRIEIPWDRFAYVGTSGGTTFKPKGDLDADKSPSIAGAIMGEEEVPFSKEMIPARLAEFRIVTPEHAKIAIDDIETMK